MRSAAVFDEAGGQQAPCKVQQHRDKRYVFWTRVDDGSAAKAATNEEPVRGIHSGGTSTQARRFQDV